MHPQELGALHRLHCTAIDDEWDVWCVFLSEVHSYLFCLIYIEMKIIVVTPVDELMYLLSVD